MNEEVRKYIEYVLQYEIQFVLSSLDENELNDLVKDAMEKIDWDNEVLMHKDFKWIVRWYLRNYTKYKNKVTI